MKKPNSEDKIDKKDIFSSVNQLSESKPHILRKVFIGTIMVIMLAIGLIMLIGTNFADACAVKILY